MARTRRRIVDSPIGKLRLMADDGALLAVSWTDEEAEEETDGGDETGAATILNATAAQLAEYFTGARRAFALPIRADGTPFRKRVWSAMADIPYGQTSSYGEVARVLGSGPRAVGNACGANPLPIIVPCHRVLAGQGLGGYSGFGGVETKRFLLAHERRWLDGAT